MFQAQNPAERKRWFLFSVCVNLGFLALFKYFNFFIDSFSEILTHMGMNANIPTLKLILPVGISFYTFHGLSYVIDIYKNRIKPEHNFIDYAVFVSYFPLLIAGPIERATHLLPQLKKEREFRYSNGINGIQQILWGLFKKIVVADNCAIIVNQIFNNYQSQTGITLLSGAILFTFQIYGDFSGYSDIAIGTSRLFGINLIRNFNYPYFSRDIAEFWRRWHISLTTWFRDYIYIPLGGSRTSKLKIIRNTLIIFIISGFWHGANWTFIVWGAYHAILFLPLIILNRNRRFIGIVAQGHYYPRLKELVQMLSTFIFVMIGWIFFRSKSVEQALEYIYRIIKNKHKFMDLEFFFNSGISKYTIIVTFISIIFMLLTEWHYRECRYGFKIKTHKFITRAFLCMALCIIIFLCHGNPAAFIYFQF
jgi:D-alanyl-lipoteichoic acid acyltransferase DltB (MBOAT superfamily)